jgi:hypothetical protein
MRFIHVSSRPQAVFAAGFTRQGSRGFWFEFQWIRYTHSPPGSRLRRAISLIPGTDRDIVNQRRPDTVLAFLGTTTP